MNTLRRHLNYANIVATLALLFAMGGSAVAAKHYLISSTKQINPKVLRKLKGNSGPRGLPGERGLSGPRGAIGLQGAHGFAGAKGLQGERGPRGETGLTGQARAYANITPGGPAVVQPGSRGVVSATTLSGSTCVVLESAIAVSSVTPVVTANSEDVNFAAAPGGCFVAGVAGVQVLGFNQDGTPNATAEFSIVVP